MRIEQQSLDRRTVDQAQSRVVNNRQQDLPIQLDGVIEGQGPRVRHEDLVEGPLRAPSPAGGGIVRQIEERRPAPLPAHARADQAFDAIENRIALVGEGSSQVGAHRMWPEFKGTFGRGCEGKWGKYLGGGRGGGTVYNSGDGTAIKIVDFVTRNTIRAMFASQKPCLSSCGFWFRRLNREP